MCARRRANVHTHSDVGVLVMPGKIQHVIQSQHAGRDLGEVHRWVHVVLTDRGGGRGFNTHTHTHTGYKNTSLFFCREFIFFTQHKIPAEKKCYWFPTVSKSVKSHINRVYITAWNIRLV